MQALRRIVEDPHAALFARTFISFVLIAAGATKLAARKEFVGVVRSYGLLPFRMAGAFGQILPPAELIIAAGILFGVLTHWLAAAASALFLLFACAVAVNILRGRRDISCGCFGPQSDHKLNWSLVARNLALAGLAVLASQGFGVFASGAEQLLFAEKVATVLTALAALALWWLWAVISSVAVFNHVEGHHHRPTENVRPPKLFSIAKAERR